jgi:hypothetical protein
MPAFDEVLASAQQLPEDWRTDQDLFARVS